MADAGAVAAATGQPAAAVPQSQDLRGVPDAVARVQNILNAEEGASPHKRTPAQAETPAPQEQVAGEQEATPDEEAPAGPNKQVEGEETSQEDAQAIAEIPLDQLENVEIDLEYEAAGKKISEKKTIKELRQGYMRDADYRHKTAELARQRETIPHETRKAVEAERATYLKELQTMNDLVTQVAADELANVDWADLSKNNAFEYVRLDNRRKEINSTLEKIKTKQQEVLAKHLEEQNTAKRDAAVKARTQLEQEIPGWNDALYSSLMKAGIEKYGYKQEEVATWIDPRAFKLLHKAYLYDQGQTQKSAPPSDKKVVVPPKVMKPGVVRDVNQAQARDANAMKQLRGSGKIEDAAAVIKSRYG